MVDTTATMKSGSTKTVRKVLKWIFASLVFLVLVLALFFQVSWKIDALLLIVLLTLTVVPSYMIFHNYHRLSHLPCRVFPE